MTREPTYAELEEVLAVAREYVIGSRTQQYHNAFRALERLTTLVERLDGRLAPRG